MYQTSAFVAMRHSTGLSSRGNKALALHNFTLILIAETMTIDPYLVRLQAKASRDTFGVGTDKRMKKIVVTVTLLGILVTGCATSPQESYLDSLRKTKIQMFELKDVSLQEALVVLRQEWKKQTGTDLPVVEVKGYVKTDPPQEKHISLRAHDISFHEALRLTALLTGYRLSFREGSVLLADVYPGEFMSFQWKLDEKTKASLGLGVKPDADDIREALSVRGVDFSAKDMKITVLDEDLVVIGGFAENADLAKSILVLSKAGYEVKKQ